MPALELFFTRNRPFHVAEQVKVDEHVDIVLRREPWQRIVAMLPEPTDQLGGHTDVKRSARVTRKNVNAWLTLVPHGLECGREGALKQVQGDDN